MDTDVLIVGAGPTGLALAIALEKSGIPFRIIDAAAEPGTASRAIAVAARTLEFYDQFGFGSEVVAAGLKLDTPTIWHEGKKRGIIRFGDIGSDLSPHPYVLMYPQDAHERLLISHLHTQVERPRALQSFTQNKTGITATLEDGEVIHAKYICGCDGAHSKVRNSLGAGFPGGTYEDMFYVADVDATSVAHSDEFYIFIQGRGFLLALPLPQKNRFRLIGVVPQDIQKPADQIIFDDVAAQVHENTPLDVTHVHWFSTYHVHHRVTEQFRHGRAFLLGDAAHIHSPAGGQGMNTGIGDAINLGWKIAATLRGASDVLLDTYHAERHAFAEVLVKTTDRAFQAVTGRNTLSRIFRGWVFPTALPALMQFRAMRRLAFKTISQTGIQYHASALSEGRAGLKAG
ncbi:MAG TPA: FAD-dependent monooxygenase, partial [Alphaproteobacteria bacterium]